MQTLENIKKYSLSVRQIPEVVFGSVSLAAKLSPKEIDCGIEEVRTSLSEPDKKSPESYVVRDGVVYRLFRKFKRIPENAGYWMCKQNTNTDRMVAWDYKDCLAPTLEESVALWVELNGLLSQEQIFSLVEKIKQVVKTPETPRPIDLVVTKHKAMVAYLDELGLVDSSVKVIPHAIAYEVRDKHVAGVLPHRLSVLTKSYTEVPMLLPPNLRGKELTLEQVRLYAGDPVTYVVRLRE